MADKPQQQRALGRGLGALITQSRAKADVARKLVKARKVTAVQYKKAVEDAVKMQAKAIKTLKKTDLNDIKDRLMDGWDKMANKVAVSVPVKAIKKTVSGKTQLKRKS